MLDVQDAVATARGQAAFELLRQRLQRLVLVPAPAVGAEFSVSPPAGVAWELLTLRYLFAASAVVATRSPQVIVQDADGNRGFRLYGGTGVAASAQGEYAYLAGAGAVIGGSPAIAPLPSPPLVLLPGWVLKSSTGSLDVGDAYTGVTLLVREWNVNLALTMADWLEGHMR